MSDASKPLRLVTVFSDYVCPFCYIGFLRLEKLRAEFDLKINWRHLEIHPENPAQGRPVEDLGYSDAQWNEMMGALGEMAREEGVRISPHTLTTNSHKALLLAESAKEEGKDVFYALHRRIFEAYFGDNRNIGDERVLRGIAAETGVSESCIERAWNTPEYEARLSQNLQGALALGVTGTPTFFFDERKLTGALPTERLLQAARAASTPST